MCKIDEEESFACEHCHIQKSEGWEQWYNMWKIVGQKHHLFARCYLTSAKTHKHLDPPFAYGSNSFVWHALYKLKSVDCLEMGDYFSILRSSLENYLVMSFLT